MELKYTALTLGLPDELFSGIQSLLTTQKLRLLPSLTVNDASRLLSKQMFHLLIINLEYLKKIQQIDWLAGIRRISFAPLIVLSDTPELDLHSMIQIGVDICAPSKGPYSAIADLAHALLRRYTEYNHYNGPGSIEVSPFSVGDIFIDPPRRIVEVRGQRVDLKRREFSLLLYFMRNPNIVLSSEQICEHAWGMTSGYDHGVAHPIYLLRRQIEPDPETPTYIQTVHRSGYRFTPNYVETCDICHNCVSVLS